MRRADHSIYSMESEMVAIAMGFACDEYAYKFCQMLQARMFFVPVHDIMATAIHAMHREGFPIDFVTAKQYLIERGYMAGDDQDPGPRQITMRVYLETIACAMELDGLLESNARRVRDLWRLRRIRERCLETAEIAIDPEKTLEYKLEAAATITAGLFVSDEGEAVTAETVDIEPRSGLTLHMGPELDKATGGCHPAQLNVVQGATKAGKTTVLAQMAMQALWAGESVIYVPIADLTPGDLARRIIRQNCGWDRMPNEYIYQEIYKGAIKEFRALKDRLVIYDPNAKGKTTDIEDITSWLDGQIHRKRPNRIFLDYFQRFTTTASREVGAQMYAVIADKLGKWTHRHEDILTFVGSQETDDGRTRWSRELENETALKLRVTKPEGDESRRVISVDLNRFGPMGAQVGYGFDKKYLILREDA